MLRAQLTCAVLVAALCAALAPAQEKRSMIESRLEILTVEAGARELVFSAWRHFEAPNSPRDGELLLFDQEGRIDTLPLDSRGLAFVSDRLGQ